MVVKWPIIPIINQGPISRLAHYYTQVFTTAQREYETHKVARVKGPRKKKEKEKEK